MANLYHSSDAAPDSTTIPKTVSPDDVFIAVIGMTGTGKSTFISMCTGEAPLQRTDGLESCTERVSLHTMKHGDTTIHLIDTPGFDDTRRSDADIFNEIAFWLMKSYQFNVRLSGIVYLHRITDPRLQGTALRGLEIFKKMCGAETFPAVVLATTHWDEVPLDAARSRQRELESNPAFWGDMRFAGSRATMISAGVTDALLIINHIATKDLRVTLALQRQMVDEKRAVHETDAGMVLYHDWIAERERLEQEVEEVRSELHEAISSHRDQRTKELRGELSRFSADLKKKDGFISVLEQNPEELARVWDLKIRQETDMLRSMSVENQNRLVKLEERYKAEISYEEKNTAQLSRLELEMKKLRSQNAAISRAKDTHIAMASMVFGGINAATGIISTGIAIASFLPLVGCTIM